MMRIQLLRHIVFLTPGFAASEQDTTTIPAMQLFLRALQKQSPEIKITILTFQFPFTTQPYHWNGCEVIPLNGKNKMHRRMLVWHKAYTLLKEIHRKDPIDIVHSFWLGECAFIGYWFAKKNKLSHVLTLMGQDVLKRNYYAKLIDFNPKTTLSVSKFQQTVFFDNYGIKTQVIPFGVAPEEFTVPTEKTIDIIGVGSLTSLKNYDLFIDIIFELNKVRPITAVLVGDGIQKGLLLQKIQSLQLEKVIIVKGSLDYSETISLISKAKILLHTSHFESFGLIFAEALQARTMIISKKTGCAFDSGNWVTANTKTEMITACQQLLMAEFNELEENPFTIEKTAQAYIKLYHG